MFTNSATKDLALAFFLQRVEDADCWVSVNEVPM